MVKISSNPSDNLSAVLVPSNMPSFYCRGEIVERFSGGYGLVWYTNGDFTILQVLRLFPSPDGRLTFANSPAELWHWKDVFRSIPYPNTLSESLGL